MNEWRNRPLDSVYPVIFIDAINVKVRDGQVSNRPVYVVIGVTVAGERDILGLWAGDGTTVWDRTVVQTSSVHSARAGEVPVVTCTVPGRTYADASPSRSSCRPVRPGRWRASHRSAGAAPTGGWSAEMRFRRGGPRSRGPGFEGAALVNIVTVCPPVSNGEVFAGIDWAGRSIRSA